MQNISKQIELNNGLTMPLFGLGTYLLKDPQLIEQIIRRGLDLGYRHIDTAIMYENESYIGDALQKIFQEGKYKREDLFIATKIFPHKSVNTIERIKQCLKELKLDYVDIIYLHWPASPPTEKDELTHKPVHQMWPELEESQRMKYTKSLGISNFNVQSIMDLLAYCQIKPVCNQIEVNVYLQQPRLIQFCKRFNIQVVAYSPLARCGQCLNEPLLIELSQKYNKTIAQIMLNFLLRQEIVVIPKTSNVDRVSENFDSLQFILSDEDMNKIKTLDKNQRIVEPYVRDWWRKIPYFN